MVITAGTHAGEGLQDGPIGVEVVFQRARRVAQFFQVAMSTDFSEAYQRRQHPGPRRRGMRLRQRILYLLGQPRKREVVCAPLEQGIGQAGH